MDFKRKLRSLWVFLGGILLVLLIILIGVTYFIGTYHSLDKHKDSDKFTDSEFIILYRGIEYWWHDDYKDINWDDRLQTDMVAISFIMVQTTSNEPRIIEGSGKAVENLSKRIKKYPQTRREFLINGTKKIIKFSNSINDDFLSCINKKFYDSTYVFVKSEKSKRIESELSYYKVKNFLDTYNLGLTKSQNIINQNIIEDSLLTESEMYNSMREISKNMFQEQKRIFKVIFNEEF